MHPPTGFRSAGANPQQADGDSMACRQRLPMPGTAPEAEAPAPALARKPHLVKGLSFLRKKGEPRDTSEQPEGAVMNSTVNFRSSARWTRFGEKAPRLSYGEVGLQELAPFEARGTDVSI